MKIKEIELKHGMNVKINEVGNVTIYDENNNRIYYESSYGYWSKCEYDKNNNRIYFEDSDGNWVKREYDENSNKVYYEDSDGDWSKSEYDKNNNEIYFENSYGKIIDNRPKEAKKITMSELNKILGYNVEIVE